ncbi:hypothetical protein CEXT_419171 [Caerostris extrusa]|uniref:Uncharacterized protein n=1 Tax=Caerostris extrusa TaxID=172846 RepID=A0AAV4RSK9_CAEEX|nr:hypothetical protein CEXT_419171 [Caerostris extrusa]
MAFGSITTKDVMSLLIQSAFTAVFSSQRGSGTTVWEVRSKQDSTVGRYFEGHREYFVNYSSFGMTEGESGNVVKRVNEGRSDGGKKFLERKMLMENLCTTGNRCSVLIA